MPTVLHCTTDYSEQYRLKMNVNDAIAIIDDRPELQFIKGQNLATYEIGTFPRHCVEQQNKRAGISRPLQESFRHTGHGSSFGKCWGNPSVLDPENLAGKITKEGVQLRSKTLGSIQHDRKGKCTSEQYVKERRLTAHKQFAYNKLKTDRAMAQNINAKHDSNIKQKPERPPMPNISKKTEEGVLIDLSPEESSALRSLNQSGSKTNICLLDEPIDVPTQGTTSRDFIAESEAAWEVSSSQDTPRKPPPYQFPPTYSNTLGFGLSENASPKFNSSRLQHSQTLDESDPFNTTHISLNGQNLNQIYGSSGSSAANIRHMSLGSIQGGELYENREAIHQQQQQQQSMGQVPPRSNYGMIQVLIIS